MLEQVGPQPALDNGLVGLRTSHPSPKRACRKFWLSLLAVYRSCTRPSRPVRSKSPSLALTSLQVAADLSLFVMRSIMGSERTQRLKIRTSAFVSSQDRRNQKVTRSGVVRLSELSLLAWRNGCSALPDLGPFRTGSHDGRLWRKAVAGILGLTECASGRTISPPSQLICAESHGACVGRTLQSQRTCVGNGP